MAKIGVCSWSLQPESAGDLCAKVKVCGLSAVQLALDPIREGKWGEAETVRALRSAGIEVLSGMMMMEGEDYSTLESIKATGGVRPDRTWERNLAAADANADLAKRLGLKLVTFHAGFLPHEDGDDERAKMIERLRRLVDVFSARGVKVAFETGQESAETLEGVMRDLGRASVGVNFDPANMLLYGMGEPVAALRGLAPRVRQLHIKDARPSPRPGEWGEEVVAGTGAVDWGRFFGFVREMMPRVGLVVEREAGTRRVEDVRLAVEMIESHLGNGDT